MKKTFILLVVASVSALNATASVAAKLTTTPADPQTPFTVQDLVKLNQLGGAALSHDGTKLVYSVHQKEHKGKRQSDLYLQYLNKNQNNNICRGLSNSIGGFPHSEFQYVNAET